MPEVMGHYSCQEGGQAAEDNVDYSEWAQQIGQETSQKKTGYGLWVKYGQKS